MGRNFQLTWVVGILGSLLLSNPAEAGRRRAAPPHEAIGHQLFASPQVNPIVLSNDGSRLYVAATTSNRVDIFDTASNSLVAGIRVGIDPVSLAV